jgi:hypothetical protein
VNADQRSRHTFFMLNQTFAAIIKKLMLTLYLLHIGHFYGLIPSFVKYLVESARLTVQWNVGA